VATQVLASPSLEQAAYTSLTNAFQDRRITSALHPAEAQIQGAYRPLGTGYGAIGFNDRSLIPSSRIVAHSMTICFVLLIPAPRWSLLASFVPRDSAVNLVNLAR
jgi:hypothetical protein